MISGVTARQDKYYASDRLDIIEFIPRGVKRVLDVGCGYGNMGRRLREEFKAEVVGIEKEERALNIAKDNVDKLIIGDVETITLPFKQGYFDCIVYGSILEHLRDPWKLLKNHAFYLRKGGSCVACLPNISHYSVIQNLLRDKWEYAPSGLLDDSHLRFFTFSGIEKMFRDAGYNIEEEKRFIRASKSKKVLNKLLFGKIKHLLTEEYIIRARLI